MIVYGSNWRFICFLCLLTNASCWLVSKRGNWILFSLLCLALYTGLLSLKHSTAVKMISITLVTNAMILDMINGFGEIEIWLMILQKTYRSKLWNWLAGVVELIHSVMHVTPLEPNEVMISLLSVVFLSFFLC